MRLILAAVGRARSGVESRLYEHYAARLTWPLQLKEIELGRALPPALQKREEGERLIAALPEAARVFALDERGELVTSEGLARAIAAWRDGGVPAIGFLIGGAEGLSEAALARAERVIALGRVTWPHLLVRGLLAEQLYRAQQILAGHPYHRG